MKIYLLEINTDDIKRLMKTFKDIEFVNDDRWYGDYIKIDGVGNWNGVDKLYKTKPSLEARNLSVTKDIHKATLTTDIKRLKTYQKSLLNHYYSLPGIRSTIVEYELNPISEQKTEFNNWGEYWKNTKSFKKITLDILEELSRTPISQEYVEIDIDLSLGSMNMTPKELQSRINILCDAIKLEDGECIINKSGHILLGGYANTFYYQQDQFIDSMSVTVLNSDKNGMCRLRITWKKTTRDMEQYFIEKSKQKNK